MREGWSICYETTLRGRVVIRCWAVFRGGGGGEPLRFDFWQELDRGALGIGAGVARATATLVCGEDLFPQEYEFRDGGGEYRIEFSREKDEYRAVLASGEVVGGSMGGAEFLLGANMLPQLALRLRRERRE